MTAYAEFHLGRTITLSALSDLLMQIALDRFQGFIRVNEAGEGRFVLSFPRADGPDVTLCTLIRENPSRLYAERSTTHLGNWVMDVYAGEIAARTGALVATEQNRSLHRPAARFEPTFADWLLADPQRDAEAEPLFARYAPSVPLPLRGVVRFNG